MNYAVAALIGGAFLLALYIEFGPVTTLLVSGAAFVTVVAIDTFSHGPRRR